MFTSLVYNGEPPNIVLAQVGFGFDFTVAILLLFLIAALGLIGLFICVFSLIYKKWLLFFAGLVLASPALYIFGVRTIIEKFPHTRSWDFSSNRSVSQLDKKPSHGSTYYYQGNIRSTIKLSSNRQWSGKASLIDFEASSGLIQRIGWHGQSASVERTYKEAKRILSELGFEKHNLDSWYEKVRRGEYAKFHVSTEKGANPEIRAYLQSFNWEKETREASWALMIDVEWKEAGL